MRKSVLASLAVLLAVGVAAAQPITELTVAERFGLARTDEPVRMGVPLPEGAAKDVGELALSDASGRPIAAQFTPAMRWPDGSLRWVQMVFKASVPANGKLVVQLAKGKPAASTDKLTVAEADGAVTVQSGSVKLTVKGAGFNVFDALAVDPAGKGGYVDLVKGHGEGVVADIGGKTYKSSLDKTGQVAVVEQGPECVVLKATGKLTSEAGESALDYACWIHVFAGSPIIKVDLAYTNAQGEKPADHLVVKDLSVVLPLADKPTGYAIGGEGQVFAGGLGAGQSAEIAAVSSDKSIIKAAGQEVGQAKGKSTKPLTIGWADASSGRAGLAVAVRWFWQMFPKSLAVSGDGTIRVALWSSAASDKPLDVYMGQGRTHYLTFLAHGPLGGEALSAALSPAQAPLRAVASPEYYCRVAKAFGKVADSDPALYADDLKDTLKTYDETLSKSLDAIVKKIDGCTYQNVTMDSYGYMAFGDLFHWANKPGDTSPANILWESNYYDYPWACILQFARTGQEKFLDVGDRNGLHLADVFMCKWHPQEKLRGACRYSPPADHVGLDKSTFEPYVSVEFNHHKAQSILARYLLLGDLRAKDDFLLALNNALKNPEGSWGQCRGPGAKLATLYEGHLLTGDPACMERMKATAAGGIKCKDDPSKLSKQGKSGYFMMGVAMEGLLYYHWLTGDAGAAETAQAVCDFLLDGRGLQGPQLAYPLAFSFRLTGDAKYRDAAVKLLAKSSTEMRPKGFGVSWRSTPYAWYYLSSLGEKDKVGAAGK